MMLNRSTQRKILITAGLTAGYWFVAQQPTITVATGVAITSYAGQMLLEGDGLGLYVGAGVGAVGGAGKTGCPCNKS